MIRWRVLCYKMRKKPKMKTLDMTAKNAVAPQAGDKILSVYISGEKIAEIKESNFVEL